MSTSGEHFGCLFPNLPTMRSSCSVERGRMRVQMSMVNRVLLLLKMEAKEDMRAASMTASIRPRKPAGRKEGRWVGLMGREMGSIDCTSLSCALLTIWHNGHHQFGISDIGASHLSSTHLLTHLRDNTADLICSSWKSRWLLLNSSWLLALETKIDSSVANLGREPGWSCRGRPWGTWVAASGSRTWCSRPSRVWDFEQPGTAGLSPVTRQAKNKQKWYYSLPTSHIKCKNLIGVK